MIRLPASCMIHTRLTGPVDALVSQFPNWNPGRNRCPANGVRSRTGRRRTSRLSHLLNERTSWGEATGSARANVPGTGQCRRYTGPDDIGIYENYCPYQRAYISVTFTLDVAVLSAPQWPSYVPWRRPVQVGNNQLIPFSLRKIAIRVAWAVREFYQVSWRRYQRKF